MDSTIVHLVSDTLQDMLSVDALADTNVVASQTSVPFLDNVYKISMIIIGACNLIFAFYLFYYNKKENKKKEQKTERKSLLNNLVLRYKLTEFYLFYNSLLKESSILLQNDTKSLDVKKNTLDDKYSDVFSDFRLSFIESLGAIDESLYGKVLSIADNLQSVLSQNLFDEGVNLNVKEKYKELIENPIANAQREILSALYQYE